MADEGTITLSKDHVYGIVIVALVALLTISIFTNGFGIIPVKGNTGECWNSVNTTGTASGTGSNKTSGTIDLFAGLNQLSVGVGNLPVRGQESAPVTWVEFSDFQCPFCAKLYLQTEKQIQTTYINTGKVKMYFRNFPLSFHDKAQAAAEAVVCASEQGKFWEMHDKLFTEQSAWASSSDVQSAFTGYASGFGLDSAKFGSCTASGKYYNDVQSDLREGQSYGVQGTPGVFLILPKAKTDISALKTVLASYGDGMKLYQNTDSVIVFVGGAYPYSAFSSLLNTVTY